MPAPIDTVVFSVNYAEFLIKNRFSNKLYDSESRRISSEDSSPN